VAAALLVGDGRAAGAGSFAGATVARGTVKGAAVIRGATAAVDDWVGGATSATFAPGAPHADETTATETAMSASAGRRGTDMLARVYRGPHERPSARVPARRILPPSGEA
jgi:hypothetical protein